MAYRGFRGFLSASVVMAAPGLLQLIAVSPASATSPRDAHKALADAAKKACSVGDVAKGIELLGELYVETNDLVYVHNQGRCYQQNGEPGKAILRFEEYLRKATNIDAEVRASVQGYIAECQAKLDRGLPPGEAARVSPAKVSAQTEPTAPLPPDVKLVQSGPVPKPAGVPAESATGSGQGLRIGEIASAVTGLVGAGVGVAFNIKERSLHDQMANNATENTSSNENRRESYETISIIGYTVGAVALATAAILYGLGAWQRGHSQEQLAFVPDLASGRITFSLLRAF
jgi:hypothetical protein